MLAIYAYNAGATQTQVAADIVLEDFNEKAINPRYLSHVVIT